MTEEKFYAEHIEGHWDRKWIIFGPKEWSKPYYQLRIFASQKAYIRDMPVEGFKILTEQADTIPKEVYRMDGNRWWLFRGRCFRHPAAENNAEVIKGLIIQRDAREKAKREKAIRIARSEEN